MAAATAQLDSHPLANQNRAQYLFPLCAAGTLIHNIQKDLSVDQLNDIHGSLYMAEAEWGISPLHSQRIWGRNIVICEDAGLHLLWYDDIIYIKPMPLYLLDQEYFQQHVRQTANDTKELVNGFLKSYRSLIQHPSDVKVANISGLLPETFTWDRWVEYVDAVIDPSLSGPYNKRYEYGELKLRNLNWLMFLLRCRRYHFPHGSYHNLLRRRLTTIIAIFSVIALSLTAMQVLVGIQWAPTYIQKISYWFAISSLLFLAGAIAVVPRIAEPEAELGLCLFVQVLGLAGHPEIWHAAAQYFSEERADDYTDELEAQLFCV
ncbi:hypothetical protein BDW59DRAFT_157162 [Aspergillus cavernicola]|uniref:Uncharacterized protein n=1 Tax=Aspergillus cavernicola TaxID=176166 RepID=A0ABR4J1V0_9EURO